MLDSFVLHWLCPYKEFSLNNTIIIPRDPTSGCHPGSTIPCLSILRHRVVLSLELVHSSMLHISDTTSHLLRNNMPTAMRLIQPRSYPQTTRHNFVVIKSYIAQFAVHNPNNGSGEFRKNIPFWPKRDVIPCHHVQFPFKPCSKRTKQGRIVTKRCIRKCLLSLIRRLVYPSTYR